MDIGSEEERLYSLEDIMDATAGSVREINQVIDWVDKWGPSVYIEPGTPVDEIEYDEDQQATANVLAFLFELRESTLDAGVMVIAALQRMAAEEEEI